MEFFGRRSAADIVKCVMSDTQHVEYGLITTGLSVVILEIGSILFSGIFLFLLNWKLAVISYIGLTFCTIAPAKIAQRATEGSYQLMEKEGQIASGVEENILSQSVVKIFGMETQMVKNFNTDLNDLKRVYIRATFLSYLVQKIPMIGFVMTQIVTLSVGASMTFSNVISVGTLVSYQLLSVGLNLNILALTSSADISPLFPQ